jgi:hypothetical protein
MDQQEGLAQFHRTISEQLNSRLEESPRFFWALVAISTAYGYALWGAKSDPSVLAQREIVVRLTAILAFLATLWASWYLAALGYAFRFLQNTQHCIEHALGWAKYAPENTKPPENARWVDSFWLLPGIYHPHALGLCVFLSLISFTSLSRWHSDTCIISAHIVLWLAGLICIVSIHRYYLAKFAKRFRDPTTVESLQKAGSDATKKEGDTPG